MWLSSWLPFYFCTSVYTELYPIWQINWQLSVTTKHWHTPIKYWRKEHAKSFIFRFVYTVLYMICKHHHFPLSDSFRWLSDSYWLLRMLGSIDLSNAHVHFLHACFMWLWWIVVILSCHCCRLLWRGCEPHNKCMLWRLWISGTCWGEERYTHKHKTAPTFTRQRKE